MSFSLQGLGLTHANGHVALADITLRAAQGESIALIGPSGAGKTTLLSTLGTALPPTLGQIEVLGQAVPFDSRSGLRQLRAHWHGASGRTHSAAPAGGDGGARRQAGAVASV